MSDKPEALQLADSAHVSHRVGWQRKAAAELRRLHAENETLKTELAEQARVNGMGGEREARLMALNTELVEALRVAVDSDLGAKWVWPVSAKETWMNNARAALAKVEASK